MSAVSVFASSHPSPQPPVPSIKIIENKGQWDPHILFKANIPSGDLFITKNELVYAMVDADALHAIAHRETSNQVLKGHNYKMTFKGGSANIDVTKINPSTETYNYFIGNDAQKWASSCRAYEKIVLHNMYLNIDVEIVAKSDYLKINYILRPGANPNQIQLVYTGADQLSLVESSLHIQTSVANIKEEEPYAFQANQTISCAYTLKDSTIGYRLGQYDRHATLVIDPNIVFGTYSGSVADNFGFTATYDNAGNGYTAGTVYGVGFPVTFGAYLQTFQGGTGYPSDIGVLKFSADGKQLLYATYLGGTNNEQPHSIICNGASELYILGTTESNNFPVTATAVDKFHGGGVDMIIAQLSSNGTQLRASTYWGGTEDDGINGADHEIYLYDSLTSPLAYNYGDYYRGEIKLDKFGNVFVASTTRSTTANGYVTSNGFQNIFGGGGQDGCIFELSPSLSTLIFSSYLGGTGEDAIYGLCFDQSSIIVTGGTNSPNIGVNQGSLTYNGGIDGFVAKIGTFGNSLAKLVYIGTSQYDQSYFIDIDNLNHIYIAGQSVGNYPVKGSVYSTPNGHQFISILNNGLDSLMYSTVFGNGTSGVTLSPSAFMVDNCRRVYYSGWGGNTNLVRQRSASNTLGLETTPDAFQQLSNGSDFYIIALDKNLAQLAYATYLGGLSSDEHVDGGTSRFNKNGEIYQAICASCRSNSDLPTTPGAYSNVNKAPGGCNNALLRFAADPSDNPPVVKDSFIQIIAGDSAYYQYTIIDPDGDSVNAVITSPIFNLTESPAVLKTTKGKNSLTVSIAWRTSCSSVSTDTFVVKIVASDNGCLLVKSDSCKIKILVKAPPVLTPPFLECLKTINDSVLQVKWTATNFSSYFKSYQIYKSKYDNVFTPFRSKSIVTDSIIVDDSAQQHLTQNFCYFIQVVNSCNVPSVSSRTVCSMLPNDSSNPVFTFTRDTTLYIVATDTLSYTFNVSTNSLTDSVYIHQVSGTLLNTNRILEGNIVNQAKGAQYNFKWKSICDDVHTDTFRLNIMMRDNQCPQARTNIARIKIVVIPPPLFDPPSMQCTRSIDQQTVLVRWDKTTVNSRYFSHYVLIRKNANGTITPITSSYTNNAFFYNDPQAFNNTTDNICYAAYAVNICNNSGDTSNEVCTVLKNDQKPKPLYIYTTTVVDNKKVMTTWAKTTESNFLAYKIYRQANQSESEFLEYATFENQNDTLLIDENVDVQKSSYCYRIKQLNECGLTNESDYLSCSILLTGKSDPFTHQLKWSDYDYFKQGLDAYTTLRSEPETNFTTLGKTGYKQSRLIDDQLNKENGLYYYQIVAKEINSPFSSTSNTIELIQSPLLHVPNAFSPNDDGNNDTWHPVPVFVKDYHLRLYDRWGKLIFETQSKTEGFNGLIESAIAPSDVFVYVITYTGWDGSETSVNGNVTLIR